jgi:hypothetical protein
VPNTKVVTNIQIYLHTKFYIFVRSPNIFLFLFFLLIYSIGKIIVGRFLCGRPSSAPTLAHLCVRSRPAPSASSGHCQVGPSTSRTPHVSLTPSWAGNRYAPDPLSRRPNLSPSSAVTPPIVAGQIPIDGPSTRHHPAPQE